MFTQKPPSLRKTFSARQSGFSLVEVVLAIGVVSFAFVAVLGLLPAGLTQFRQAVDTSVSAQIARRVIEEAEQTDFDTLTDSVNTNQKTPPYYFQGPSLAKPSFRYFDESGNEILPATPSAPTTAELSHVIYHVNTRIMVQSQLPGVTTYSTALASVLVQVAFNPRPQAVPLYGSAVSPPAIPLGFNVTTLPGVKVFNYSAQIGRNF